MPSGQRPAGVVLPTLGLQGLYASGPRRAGIPPRPRGARRPSALDPATPGPGPSEPRPQGLHTHARTGGRRAGQAPRRARPVPVATGTGHQAITGALGTAPSITG